MAYRIRREQTFIEDLKKLTGNYQALIELDNCIEWALSHKPIGTFIDDGFFVWETDGHSYFEIIPSRILYKVDPGHLITLIRIEEI